MPLLHTVEPDPINDVPWHVRRGLRVDNKDRLRQLVYVPVYGQPSCGEINRPGGYTCTRPVGHPDWWKHVAADGWEILSVWGGGDPPALEGQFIDPEDGSPADPAEAKLTKAEVKIGGVYKLRDRVNKLQVIGGTDDVMPRKDGMLDVLDFTRREQRALPVEEIVPVEGLTLDMEELGWTIDFAQDLRKRIAGQAVDKYHEGKWCINGLRDGLRDLGLPEYQPSQTGNLVIKVPYTALTDTGTSDVRKAYEAALGDVLAQIKTIQIPENDYDIEVRTTEVSVGVQEVHRR